MPLAEEEAMDSGVSNQDINLNDGDADANRESDVRIVAYTPEDIQEQVEFEFIDNSVNCTSIRSQYSGEISTFHPAASIEPSIEDLDHFEEMTHSPRGEEHSASENPGNLASSTRREENSTSQISGNLATLPRREENSTREIHGNLANSTRREVNSTRESHGNLATSTRREENSTRGSHGNLASSSKVMTQKKGPLISRKSATTTTSTSSSLATTSTSLPDQSMDAVRSKLSSCITALSTKVSEKQNRSPHAPFLAYLGTKMPNVPNENLATLEKEILKLVDSFCQ